jgi:hypothetical protein
MDFLLTTPVSPRRCRDTIAAATMFTLLASGAAMAGGGNTLYVLQDASARPDIGNRLVIDQSAASNALVGTALVPATQRGANNNADLTMSGFGGTIQLLQDNSDASANPIGNSLSISTAGASVAVAVQTGDGNLASLVLAPLSAGTIVQNGDLNAASVIVSGSLAAGTIIQNGDQNTANLAVGGFSAVTYVQNGDGLSTDGLSYSGQPVTVWSNAGAVLITQSIR